VTGIFVLTRREPVDASLAGEAERLGWRVVRLSLLATEVGADGARFLEWLRRASSGAAIAWTSRRAGEALARIALPAAKDALARWPLFALGAESAAPLRDGGLTVEVPPGDPGAANLAREIARVRGARGIARVAFLHGDKALPDLPATLRREGIEVEGFELYRTRFLSPDVSQLNAAIASGTRINVAFFSPSGVEALERVLDPGTLDALRASAQIIARGVTTYRAVLDRGYRRSGDLMESGRAFDSFALEALQSP